jgi:hypothetical protein
LFFHVKPTAKEFGTRLMQQYGVVLFPAYVPELVGILLLVKKNLSPGV